MSFACPQLLVNFKNFNFCDIDVFQMHMIKTYWEVESLLAFSFCCSYVIVTKQMMTSLCLCSSAYTNISHFIDNSVFLDKICLLHKILCLALCWITSDTCAIDLPLLYVYEDFENSSDLSVLCFHISSLLELDFLNVACKNKNKQQMNVWHLQHWHWKNTDIVDMYFNRCSVLKLNNSAACYTSTHLYSLH